MTGLMLKELDVTDFRSIRGHVHAPLDAQVVLVHGDNGAGKTSLLSAIELALTGGVQFLRRADPDYAEQLMHRTAVQGSVTVTTTGDASRRYGATLGAKGIKSSQPLDSPFASFFSERSYLPQSLLGQLIQIYQDAGDGADSPLARFVGELLRLDRLDAIESGLKPLVDVRNVRKIADGWSEKEIEKMRLGTLIGDQKRSREQIVQEIGGELSILQDAIATLGLVVRADEKQLDAASESLNVEDDERALGTLTDRRRRLASIRREIAEVSRGALDATPNAPPGPNAQETYTRWESAHGARFADVRKQVEALLPDVALPGDMAQFVETALRQVAPRAEQAAIRKTKATADAERLGTARAELIVARSRAAAIDGEVASIPTTSGGLATILSEITSFIDGETCPVCNRDFAEVQNGSLVEHVHAKVRTLSASAARLLALGRTRTETQLLVERLEREIAALERGVPTARALAELERQAAAMETARADVAAIADVLQEGARLRLAEVAARRGVIEAQSRSLSLTAARETLSQFASSFNVAPMAEGEDLDAVARRLNEMLTAEATRLEGRLTARWAGREAIKRTRSLLTRRGEVDRIVAGHEKSLKEATAALLRAQGIRDQGLKVRNAVDAVRSSIIRREFNDRLNQLWRDLFVRLAPDEPFIPAFRILDSGTQRIQPKLVTDYRDGGAAGGTPGAMLSAGNLNTAALTLFLALHLSVPKTLPWLILDDPVQSMDDVHIAHLAALLRTLSKEHERQIVVAVHDRHLFDYLRLELSPAYPGDSLLTLELTRAPQQDTRCLARRLGYQEETALLAA